LLPRLQSPHICLSETAHFINSNCPVCAVLNLLCLCLCAVAALQSPHICLADIAHFINSKGLARVELREEDILTIMETLIADGR
jgi:hypothetical protein